MMLIKVLALSNVFRCSGWAGWRGNLGTTRNPAGRWQRDKFKLVRQDNLAMFCVFCLGS